MYARLIVNTQTSVLTEKPEGLNGPHTASTKNMVLGTLL